MPAKNPTRELFLREGLRFGPYANFRERYELAEMFMQRPQLLADDAFSGSYFFVKININNNIRILTRKTRRKFPRQISIT